MDIKHVAASVLAGAITIALSGCGGSSSTGSAALSSAPSERGLEVAAGNFHNALLSGDTAGALVYLHPSCSAESRESLVEASKALKVTARGARVKISSAHVSGKRGTVTVGLPSDASDPMRRIYSTLQTASEPTFLWDSSEWYFAEGCSGENAEDSNAKADAHTASILMQTTQTDFGKLPTRAVAARSKEDGRVHLDVDYPGSGTYKNDMVISPKNSISIRSTSDSFCITVTNPGATKAWTLRDVGVPQGSDVSLCGPQDGEEIVQNLSP